MVEKVTLLAFQDELKPVAQHWYKIGQQLQISESTLKTIRTVHWKSYEKCLGEVCMNWLEKETKPVWSKVVRALRSEDLVHFTGGVADDLQKKYCPQPASMSSATSAKSYTMVGIGKSIMGLTLYVNSLSSFAAMMVEEGSRNNIHILDTTAFSLWFVHKLCQFLYYKLYNICMYGEFQQGLMSKQDYEFCYKNINDDTLVNRNTSSVYLTTAATDMTSSPISVSRQNA